MKINDITEDREADDHWNEVTAYINGGHAVDPVDMMDAREDAMSKLDRHQQAIMKILSNQKWMLFSGILDILKKEYGMAATGGSLEQDLNDMLEKGFVQTKPNPMGNDGQGMWKIRLAAV